MPRLVPKGPDAAAQREWLKDRMKICTGFCNNINKPAQCEGTKPRSGDVALITCPMWQTCPCECHWNIDEMFKITGLERKAVPNPDYDPPHSDFVIPEYTADPLGIPAVTDDDTSAAPVVEPTLVAPHSPASVPLVARRTETGRTARGGLEAQVWDALRTGTFPTPEPQPKHVSEWIAEKYKIPTPSSGAINAVWDRWEKFGFATQAKKPNRFTGFTGEGTWEELAKLKGKVKRETKAAVNAAKFTPRPRK